MTLSYEGGVMHHTFLFKEGLWLAKGYFIDHKNIITPMEGEAKIIHSGDIWINEGKMKLMDDKKIEIENHYEIVPFAPGKDYTTYTILNPSLGKMKGKFVVVGDSILSSYNSLCGHYSGMEYLQRINDTSYRNKGALFQDDQKLSSWVVELKKVED